MSTRQPLVLAALTAVVSLGLLALAVQYGWLGSDVDRGADFCEAATGLVRQPVNTLSNLGFVVAGLAVAVRAGRPGGLGQSTMAQRPALATAYACIVVLLGPASMAMHATESSLGGHLDMTSMYLIAGFATAYAALRRWHLTNAAFAGIYVGILVVCVLAGTINRELPVVMFAGNVAFGVFLIVALVLERQISQRGQVELGLRWIWASAGSLLLAFAVWNTAKDGSPLCFPTSAYQGHGVWHLLCALAAWCLFRFYVSERPTTSFGATASQGETPWEGADHAGPLRARCRHGFGRPQCRRPRQWHAGR